MRLIALASVLALAGCDVRQSIIDHKRQYVWPTECLTYGLEHKVNTHWTGEVCEVEVPDFSKGETEDAGSSNHRAKAHADTN